MPTVHWCVQTCRSLELYNASIGWKNPVVPGIQLAFSTCLTPPIRSGLTYEPTIAPGESILHNRVHARDRPDARFVRSVLNSRRKAFSCDYVYKPPRFHICGGRKNHNRTYSVIDLSLVHGRRKDPVGGATNSTDTGFKDRGNMQLLFPSF